MRRAAEKAHSDGIERILAGNDCEELKQCIINLWADLDMKKRSCDEKAGRLAAMHELDKLKARSEVLEISEVALRKRIRDSSVMEALSAPFAPSASYKKVKQTQTQMKTSKEKAAKAKK